MKKIDKWLDEPVKVLGASRNSLLSTGAILLLLGGVTTIAFGFVTEGFVMIVVALIILSGLVLLYL